MEERRFWIQEGVGLGGIGDAASDKQLGENLGQAGCFGKGSGLFAMGIGYDPALVGTSARGRLSWQVERRGRLARGLRGSWWACHGSLLVLNVSMGVVNDDVLEAFDIFEQRLVALIPFGCGFMQEDEALIDEAKLDVTKHAGILAQPLSFNQLGGLFIRKVHFAGFLGERIELFAFERHLTESNEGGTDVLGHLDKVFPCVGVAVSFPNNGRDVLSDVTREAVHSVTFDEGHHVVFQR